MASPKASAKASATPTPDPAPAVAAAAVTEDWATTIVPEPVVVPPTDFRPKVGDRPTSAPFDHAQRLMDELIDVYGEAGFRRASAVVGWLSRNLGKQWSTRIRLRKRNA